MNRIYFDNASTTPIEPRVLDTMYEAMKTQFGNPSSIHYYGRNSRSLIEDARKKVANHLKSSIGEIFFTSSATEANNMVIKNCIEHLGIKRIISSPTEHHCVLYSIDYLDEHNKCKVDRLPVDQQGNISIDILETWLSESDEPTMVSLMHANNEIGTVMPFEKVSELCKKYNALFHCDTVQTIGKYDIDVSKHYVSFLSASAHKFHGPKGIGFLYMNMDNIIPPYIHGGAQERNMRAGTENLHGIIGLAHAMDIVVKERDAIIKHVSTLRNHFKKRLENEIPDIRFNGNQEDNYLHHVLSVSFPPSEKANMLMFNLDISGVSASSGSACASGIENESHVLQAINHPSDRVTIRFSFSKFNTLEEVDEVVEILKKQIH